MTRLLIIFFKWCLSKMERQLPRFPAFAFSDPNGRRYFAFPNIAEMPQRREQEIAAIMMLIDAGRDAKTLKAIGEAIKQNCEQAYERKDKGKNLAAIATLANELLMRTDILPEDAYFQLAAASCVREDEDPEGFDKSIHIEKTRYFKDQTALRGGVPFFAACPLLGTLLGASLSTEKGFSELQLGWIREAARIKAVLKVCGN